MIKVEDDLLRRHLNQNELASKYFLWTKENYPGLAISTVVGFAAFAISVRYGAPVMLMALLLGLALHPAYHADKLQSGILWTAKKGLLTGVALLGLRIDLVEISQFGWILPCIVIAVLSITIAFGIYAARVIGLSKEFSTLMSGAVAICGASAAIAISAVLPRRDYQDRELAVTVCGVTVLSTLAMILYPLITYRLGLDDTLSGIFIGGSIHDVAQVIGAGYSISPDAGDLAAFVKLIRVASLLPIVLLISISFRHGNSDNVPKWSTLLPPFLIVFMLLAAINSCFIVPPSVSDFGRVASQALLTISLVAIGMKTSLVDLTEVGHKPLVLLSLTTVFMATCLLATLSLSTHFFKIG